MRIKYSIPKSPSFVGFHCSNFERNKFILELFNEHRFIFPIDIHISCERCFFWTSVQKLERVFDVNREIENIMQIQLERSLSSTKGASLNNIESNT